jgi:hypothetical protein
LRLENEFSSCYKKHVGNVLVNVSARHNRPQERPPKNGWQFLEIVIWSNREQLDGLLTYLGLRALPKLEEDRLVGQ